MGDTAKAQVGQTVESEAEAIAKRWLGVRHSSLRAGWQCPVSGRNVQSIGGWAVFAGIAVLDPEAARELSPTLADVADRLNRELPDPTDEEMGWGVFPAGAGSNPRYCPTYAAQNQWIDVERRGPLGLELGHARGVSKSVHRCPEFSDDVAPRLGAFLDSYHGYSRKRQPPPEQPPVPTPEELAAKAIADRRRQIVAIFADAFFGDGPERLAKAERLLSLLDAEYVRIND